MLTLHWAHPQDKEVGELLLFRGQSDGNRWELMSAAHEAPYQAGGPEVWDAGDWEAAFPLGFEDQPHLPWGKKW